MIRNESGLDIFTFATKVKRPLILDGAMGSLLRKKHAPSGSLWMSQLNLDAPKDVIKIHQDYIKAGADIITTNTFRTNPEAFAGYKGVNYSDFVKLSVGLAIEASQGKKVLIAGSNTAAEDCYQAERKISYKRLTLNHHKHINLLFDSGADFILNETFSHLDEILIVCKYCSKNMLPYVISLYFDGNLRLLSGEKLSEAVEMINDFAPLAIGFNCIKPSLFSKVNLKSVGKINWGAYLKLRFGSTDR